MKKKAFGIVFAYFGGMDSVSGTVDVPTLENSILLSSLSLFLLY